MGILSFSHQSHVTGLLIRVFRIISWIKFDHPRQVSIDGTTAKSQRISRTLTPLLFPSFLFTWSPPFFFRRCHLDQIWRLTSRKRSSNSCLQLCLEMARYTRPVASADARSTAHRRATILDRIGFLRLPTIKTNTEYRIPVHCCVVSPLPLPHPLLFLRSDVRCFSAGDNYYYPRSQLAFLSASTPRVSAFGVGPTKRVLQKDKTTPHRTH